MKTNNIAVYINDKLWKVWAGKGMAESRAERDYLKEMQVWASKKSMLTEKKWTVCLTTAKVNESTNVASTDKTVAKTWDQMSSRERLSGVKGRTVWNDRSKKYTTVFDVPVEKKQAVAETNTLSFNDDDWYEINPATNIIVTQRGPSSYQSTMGQREIKLPNGNVVIKGMRAKNMKLSRDVKEGYTGIDDVNTVGFSVNSDAAYTAVIAKFGEYINHDESTGIMYVPTSMWPNVEQVAFDADGEGALQDDGYEHPDSPEVVEGSVPDLDQMPGAIRHDISKQMRDNSCKRCNGSGTIYKTPDGKVLTNNEHGAKRYKCGKCSGIGSLSEQQGATGIIANGAKVKVSYAGKMVPGKIVRYEAGKDGYPDSYVIDIGEYESLVAAKSRVQPIVEGGFNQAHEYNLDAAQKEIDRREAEGEDMSGARINKSTYEIIMPKKPDVVEGGMTTMRPSGEKPFSPSMDAPKKKYPAIGTLAFEKLPAHVQTELRKKRGHSRGVDKPAVAEGNAAIGLRSWAIQVRKEHGNDVKLTNDSHGGGTVDKVIARNAEGEIVGVYDRRTSNATVFEPKATKVAEVKSLSKREPTRDVAVAETKGLNKHVRIVMGPNAGKTGWIRQIKLGAYKGAPKTYDVDIEGGGQANGLPSTALRLIKDQGVAEGAYGPDETLADLSKISTDKLQELHALHRHYGQTNPRNKESANRAAVELKKRGVIVPIDEQGVAETSESNAAEIYKTHLIKTMPSMMALLGKINKGWTPSNDEMLAAIDTAYTVMKHTGDKQQAGQALMDELNTLHKMSQGVAEGTDSQELNARDFCTAVDAVLKDHYKLTDGGDLCWNMIESGEIDMATTNVKSAASKVAQRLVQR